MKIGFGRQDITPRVGVPLAGFGPFQNRVSVGIRDRLWARAMAVECDDSRAVVVSCDIVGITAPDTQRVRELVQCATGLSPDAVLVHCTHTHSGPDTCPTLIGWGGADLPYLELLPQWIAQASIAAVGNLQTATLSHAEVPCEGIGLNREYDRDAPPLEDVLRPDWRPAKPELTDTTCHVFRIDAEDRLLGFLSSFGCHPVCCCADTHWIHGDYCGIATSLIEREHPGATGLFLQGAEGDVNSCVVHKPEQDALLALDIVAGRFANAVRTGLREARPLTVDTVRCCRRAVQLPRRPWGLDDLRARLAQQETVLHGPTATDADQKVRMATVNAVALRKLIRALEDGVSLATLTELQGIRIGPVALLATPFEVFQAIKNDVRRQAASPLPLVLSTSNDECGYAPDRTAEARGGYAADIVPMILGFLPYRDVHDSLVRELLSLEQVLVTDHNPA